MQICKNKFFHKDFTPTFLNDPKNEYAKKMKNLEATGQADEEESDTDILHHFAQSVHPKNRPPKQVRGEGRR